jgi:glycosyltransferase involved in cell wall biosynthesis
MASRGVALIIPAWNEAGAIGAVLSEVPPELVDWVLVVCGDSTDGTAEIAVAHGARALGQSRPGYGAACRAGAEAARALGARYLVFLDGDYADPPHYLGRVLAPLLAGSADLVLGWRDLSAHPAALPPHARLGNRVVLAALGVLLGRPLRDLPSFKAIRLEALDCLQMGELSYGWTVEMIVKSVRAGLRIAEVPVVYRPRLAGDSKVSGTLHGTLGAAWKLCSCAARYVRWSPREPAARPGAAA